MCSGSHSTYQYKIELLEEMVEMKKEFSDIVNAVGAKNLYFVAPDYGAILEAAYKRQVLADGVAAVSILLTGGIVDWKVPGWREMVSRFDADILAQLEIYHWALTVDATAQRQAGVHLSGFAQAKADETAMLAKIKEAGIDVGGYRNDLDAVRLAVLAGMRDLIFEYKFESNMRGRHNFTNYRERSERRPDHWIVDENYTLVTCHKDKKYLVAVPRLITVSKPSQDSHILRRLTMVVEIKPGDVWEVGDYQQADATVIEGQVKVKKSASFGPFREEKSSDQMADPYDRYRVAEYLRSCTNERQAQHGGQFAKVLLENAGRYRKQEQLNARAGLSSEFSLHNFYQEKLAGCDRIPQVEPTDLLLPEPAIPENAVLDPEILEPLGLPILYTSYQGAEGKYENGESLSPTVKISLHGLVANEDLMRKFFSLEEKDTLLPTGKKILFNVYWDDFDHYDDQWEFRRVSNDLQGLQEWAAAELRRRASSVLMYDLDVLPEIPPPNLETVETTGSLPPVVEFKYSTDPLDYAKPLCILYGFVGFRWKGGTGVGSDRLAHEFFVEWEFGKDEAEREREECGKVLTNFLEWKNGVSKQFGAQTLVQQAIESLYGSFQPCPICGRDHLPEPLDWYNPKVVLEWWEQLYCRGVKLCSVKNTSGLAYLADAEIKDEAVIVANPWGKERFHVLKTFPINTGVLELVGDGYFERWHGKTSLKNCQFYVRFRDTSHEQLIQEIVEAGNKNHPECPICGKTNDWAQLGREVVYFGPMRLLPCCFNRRTDLVDKMGNERAPKAHLHEEFPLCQFNEEGWEIEYFLKQEGFWQPQIRLRLKK